MGFVLHYGGRSYEVPDGDVGEFAREINEVVDSRAGGWLWVDTGNGRAVHFRISADIAIAVEAEHDALASLQVEVDEILTHGGQDHDAP